MYASKVNLKGIRALYIAKIHFKSWTHWVQCIVAVLNSMYVYTVMEFVIKNTNKGDAITKNNNLRRHDFYIVLKLFKCY